MTLESGVKPEFSFQMVADSVLSKMLDRPENGIYYYDKMSLTYATRFIVQCAYRQNVNKCKLTLM